MPMSGKNLTQDELRKLQQAKIRASKALMEYEQTLLNFELEPFDIKDVRKMQSELTQQWKRYFQAWQRGKSVTPAKATVLKIAKKHGVKSPSRGDR